MGRHFWADSVTKMVDERFKKMETNVGKFAIIKDNVFLPENNLAQVHKYPYRIVNENKKKIWICLESNINVHKVGPGGSIDEVDDKSFWMKADECHIFDGNKITHSIK